jgi:hypothetical protein
MRRLVLSPRLELKIPNTSQQSHHRYPPRSARWSMPKGALWLLRLARGEIDRAEYEEKRKLIGR